MEQLTTRVAADAQNTAMTKVEAYLLGKNTQTYTAYYNGKMSFELHGQEWKDYVTQAFPNIAGQTTSENIYKTVIDMYAENLVPVPKELSGFANCLVPLLSRGECIVVVDSAGTPHFPEHYELASDGVYTLAAIFTRSLSKMLDYITFIDSSGTSRLFSKPVPDDFKPADRTQGFTFVEETQNNRLFRFALDDKGFGASLAALQDRVNHSIIDLTVVAEMYARPFWYLMNVQLAPTNPYLQNQPETQAMTEAKTSSEVGGRIFTTSSEGPFGQLEPPTISDMISYHDSILDKVSMGSGVPQHNFKPGSGTPPTGVALKVLTKRFNNKIARMRTDLEELLIELAEELGVKKTKEVKERKVTPGEDVLNAETGELTPGEDQVEETITYEYELWNLEDDLLQDAMDAHGISLFTMGYPLAYIAEVVTPGVDLDDYTDPVEEGGLPGTQEPGFNNPNPATPDQVVAYKQNPGQRARA